MHHQSHVGNRHTAQGIEKKDLVEYMNAFLLSQMPAEVGVRNHGAKAIASLDGVFLQLREMPMLSPVAPSRSNKA